MPERHLANDVAVGFGGAPVDHVAAGDEQLAEILATGADIVRRLRRGDDEIHAPCLIEHLDAERGGDIEPAVGVHAEAAHLQDPEIRNHEIAKLAFAR